MLLMSTGLSACKSKTSDPTKIERYGSGELASSGVAYVPEPVAARNGADPEAVAVALVPAGKPLTRVAEKSGYLLVEWAEDTGERKQGWLSTMNAKLSATPVQPQLSPEDKVELDPRKIPPPRPAAPQPASQGSPTPAATAAEPAAAPTEQPGEASRPAGASTGASTPGAAQGPKKAGSGESTPAAQPTATAAPTAAPPSEP
jgi:hypothetical protein